MWTIAASTVDSSVTLGEIAKIVCTAIVLLVVLTVAVAWLIRRL